MQAASHNQGTESVSTQSGPTPIAPELLALIGGGYSAPAAAAVTPMAPRNTW